MKKLPLSAVLLVACSLTVGCGRATESETAHVKSVQAGEFCKVANEKADVFLSVAHTINMGETQVIEYALTRIQNADLKSLAQKVSDDHKAADLKVQEFAQSLGANLSAPQAAVEIKALEAQTKADLEALKATPDEQFDKVFIKLMIAGHKVAAESIKIKIVNLCDQNLQTFGNDFLAKIKEHKMKFEALGGQK